jgi:hypothetical protein
MMIEMRSSVALSECVCDAVLYSVVRQRVPAGYFFHRALSSHPTSMSLSLAISTRKTIWNLCDIRVMTATATMSKICELGLRRALRQQCHENPRSSRCTMLAGE